jgi:hypothetical protein
LNGEGKETHDDGVDGVVEGFEKILRVRVAEGFFGCHRGGWRGWRKVEMIVVEVEDLE